MSRSGRATPPDEGSDPDASPPRDASSTVSAIGRATAVIMALGILDKLLALAKEVLMAARFGVSSQVDAFNIAYAYPGIVNLLFYGAFVSSLVPLRAVWEREAHDAEELRDNTLSVFYCACVFFVAVAALCSLASPFLLSLIGYGFVPDTLAMAENMERWLVWLVLLEGLGVVCCALLQSSKRFARLVMAQACINAVIIVFLIAGKNFGIMALVYGFLAGTALKAVVLITSLAGTGLRPLAPFRISHKAIRSFAHLAVPLLGSALITNSNLLVDQSMSTSLPAGGVAVLRYAYRVNDLPLQIIVMALSRAIFPFISEQAAREDKAGLGEVFRQSMVFLGVVCVPITCYVLVFAEEIVGVLLRRGAFDAEAARMTALTLRCYGLGLFFQAYAFINGAYFAALRQGPVLLRMGLATLLLNFGFNVLFLRLLKGPHAIALSTTVTMAVTSAVFLYLILGRLGGGTVKGLWRSFLAIAAASGLAAGACVPLRSLARGGGFGPFATLGMLTAVFGVITLSLIVMFKTSDLRFMLDQCLPGLRRLARPLLHARRP